MDRMSHQQANASLTRGVSQLIGTHNLLSIGVGQSDFAWLNCREIPNNVNLSCKSVQFKSNIIYNITQLKFKVLIIQ